MASGADPLIAELFALAEAVRYVAVYREGQLTTESRSGRAGASDAESDRYEELIVNPTLLKLTGQRGDIDCGGLRWVVIRYGNFHQLVVPQPWGHVSVCIEPDADVAALASAIETKLG